MLAKEIVSKELMIGDIPATLLSYGDFDRKQPGVIWYHGWSSSRASQLFRANIIASFGFHVLVADGAYHGERGTLNYEDVDVTLAKLPQVILSNLKEYPALSEAFRREAAISGPIFVAGHSMGAMTAGGLLANIPDIGGALCLNGINDWSFEELIDESKMDPEVVLGIRKFNPLAHLDHFNERPLMMINGEEDHDVNGKVQEAFYHKLKDYYRTDALEFQWAVATPHLVTTNMMEMGIAFLLKHTK